MAEVGEGDARQAKPEKGLIPEGEGREGPVEKGKENPEKEEKPEETEKGADEGHVREAPVADEVAVGAKGEREEPFERKEADVAGEIEVGMEEERAIEESSGKGERVRGGGLNGVFEGSEREGKSKKEIHRHVRAISGHGIKLAK